MSTSAELLPYPLAQIVTQVCANACGRSGQRLTKSCTFYWLNGRIVLKIARNYEPIAAGSHEVSGSIPLISTNEKDVPKGTSFFVGGE